MNTMCCVHHILQASWFEMPKPLLTESGIYHRLESWARSYLFHDHFLSEKIEWQKLSSALCYLRVVPQLIIPAFGLFGRHHRAHLAVVNYAVLFFFLGYLRIDEELQVVNLQRDWIIFVFCVWPYTYWWLTAWSEATHKCLGSCMTLKTPVSSATVKKCSSFFCLMGSYGQIAKINRESLFRIKNWDSFS